MLKAELESKGAQIVQALQAGIRRRRLNATGRLSRSIAYEVKQTSGGYTLTVSALSYIYTLVPPGRGPNRSNSGGLREAIDRWVQAKPSVVPQDLSPGQFAFLVTRKIATEGNLMYRKGPNQYNDGNLLDAVINEELIETIGRLQLQVTSVQARNIAKT